MKRVLLTSATINKQPGNVVGTHVNRHTHRLR